MTGIFALIALIFALVSIYTGVLIANELRKRGIPAKPLLVRWMIFMYLADYRRMTIKETGEVGYLYHRCRNMLALTLVFSICAILTNLPAKL